MDWNWFGTVAARDDGEVADGDDLDAEGFVPENADVVKPEAQLDDDREHFRAAEQNGAGRPRLVIVALFKHDFEEERFEGFGPGPEFFAHCGLMCQAHAVAARRSVGRFNHEIHQTHEIRNGIVIAPRRKLFVWFVYFVVSTLQNPSLAISC